MPASVLLFRTVQRDEREDLLDRHSLSTIPGAMEGKLFWTDREDAERFARMLARNAIGPSWIVEIRIPVTVRDRLGSLMTDGRPALWVDQTSLGWFNGVVLDLVIPRDER